MELLLIVSALISVVIFVPFTYYLHKKEEVNTFLKLFFVGGSAWAIAGLISSLPLLVLFSRSHYTTYQATMNDNVYIAFGIIIVFILITELFRFLAVTYMKHFENKILFAVIFGLGWTISEFITRFTGFFEGLESNFIYYLLIFLALFGINSGLSIVMVRLPENSKYFIFSVFMKLTIELSIFGAFGFFDDNLEGFVGIFGVIAIEFILVGLTLLSRKYPLED
jgi:hypothetical protein